MEGYSPVAPYLGAHLLDSLDSFLLHSAQTDYGTHPVPYQLQQGFFPRGKSGRDVKLAVFVQYLFTYLHTPWSRVLLEKLTGFQMAKKFPASCGTRRLIPHSQVPATYPILSKIDPVSTLTFHYLKIHLNIIVPSTPGSPRWSLSLSFPPKFCIRLSSLPYALHAQPHPILLDFINRTILSEECRSLNSSLCCVLHSLVTSSLFGSNILLNTLFSNTLSLRSYLDVSDQVSLSSTYLLTYSMEQSPS